MPHQACSLYQTWPGPAGCNFIWLSYIRDLNAHSSFSLAGGFFRLSHSSSLNPKLPYGAGVGDLRYRVYWLRGVFCSRVIRMMPNACLRLHQSRVSSLVRCRSLNSVLACSGRRKNSTSRVSGAICTCISNSPQNLTCMA